MNRGLIFVEGDSWVSKIGPDLADALRDLGYAIKNYGGAGDTAREIACGMEHWWEFQRQTNGEVEPVLVLGRHGERMAQAMARVSADGVTPKAVLLSLGGNDFKKFLPHVVRPAIFGKGPEPVEPLAAATVTCWLDEMLIPLVGMVISSTRKQLLAFWPDKEIPIVLHSYAAPRADGGGWGLGIGPWLLPIFEAAGYDPADKRIQIEIDYGSQLLGSALRLAASIEGALFVDLSAVITKDDYSDEMHLSKRGYAKAARAVAETIEASV